MNDFTITVLSLFGFKLSLVASGALCTYLGYRLFSIPLRRGKDGELTAEDKSAKLTLRPASTRREQSPAFWSRLV